MAFFGREEELLSQRGWLETRSAPGDIADARRHRPAWPASGLKLCAGPTTCRLPLWSAAWRKCCVLPPTAPHEKPCVLIIDECEKLDRLVVNLWGRLQAFWDFNKDGTRMLLVFSARISPWGIPTTKRSCLPG